MTTTIRIGMLGCGVVGGGVVEALHRNADFITKQFGIRFELVRVVVRNLQRPRTPHFQSDWLEQDWRKVTAAPDVDIVIEAMGGVNPAREAIESALQNGKHVITANKELLARYGHQLLRLAQESGRKLLFEASVLGGIPALHALETYFSANRITSFRGIMNGTTNYILTRMGEAQIGFAEALAEAQAAGYAEADPTSDVEGFDALFKLQILIRQAFSAEVRTEDMERQGIVGLEAVDIRLAQNLGCKVKLLAEATWQGETELSAAVRPVLLGPKDALYHVDGVQNALSVTGDLVGDLVFMGPGAGAFPTASAVVEDLVKISSPGLGRTRAAVSLSVSDVRAQAYLVKRRCERGICSGAGYSALLAQTLNANGVHYLQMAEQGYDAWVVFLREEMPESVFQGRVEEVLKGGVSSFAIYGLPADAFAGRQPAEAAG